MSDEIKKEIYTPEKGRSFSTKRGIIKHGQEILPKDCGNFNELLELGMVVKLNKVEVKEEIKSEVKTENIISEKSTASEVNTEENAKKNKKNKFFGAQKTEVNTEGKDETPVIPEE